MNISRNNRSEFTFELATPADDEAILRLLRENPVPGSVSVRYERSPSYFHGCDVMGDCHQTLVARHLPSGDIAALAGRSLRRLFINGREETVGYLGQLRVDRRFRSRWLVSGGFRFLRELHEDRRTRGYLTTIIEGNREAEGVLVSRARRHFPTYRPLGRIHTLALHVRSCAASAMDGCQVRRGDETDMDDIVAFLNRHGARRQFFPVCSVADFAPETPRTRGFRPEDFRLALRNGRIAGVMGLWDQSSFKQSVVNDYSGFLRRGRTLYNIYSRLRGFRPLPRPGEALSMGYAAFTCIADNDPRVFDLLLRQVLQSAHERGTAFLMLGLAEGDPFLKAARRYPHIAYYSRLYTVGWDDGNEFHDRLDSRISHVEPATL
jgi:hypothetical protein